MISCGGISKVMDGGPAPAMTDGTSDRSLSTSSGITRWYVPLSVIMLQRRQMKFFDDRPVMFSNVTRVPSLRLTVTELPVFVWCERA